MNLLSVNYIVLATAILSVISLIATFPSLVRIIRRESGRTTTDALQLRDFEKKVRELDKLVNSRRCDKANYYKMEEIAKELVKESSTIRKTIRKERNDPAICHG